MEVGAPKETLLVGGGGHCKSVINAMLGTGFSPGAIVDKNPSLASIMGVPVLGDDSLLPHLRARFDFALVTVGQIKNHEIRWKLYQRLQEYGYVMPTIISGTASVSPWASIGAGSTILNFAAINAEARIGENSIINTGAIIEHDATIGNNCHISTGAAVNGGAIVEDNVFVGSRAIVRECVRIGMGSVIGMGVVVKSDVPHGTMLKSAANFISFE